MRKARGSAGLAAEAIAAVLSGAAVGREDLDRDLALECRFGGEVDRAHPSFPEKMLNLILPAQGYLEDLADGV